MIKYLNKNIIETLKIQIEKNIENSIIPGEDYIRYQEKY